MTPRTIFRSIRPVVVALGALTTLGLFAPSQASAGCSHPLTNWTRLDKESSGLDLLNFVDFQTPDTAETPVLPSGPVPCTGAFCSGQPAAPMVPVSVPPVRVETWYLSDSLPACSEPGASFLATASDRVSPSFQGSTLFRPPRQAA